MLNLNGESARVLLVYPDFTDVDKAHKNSGGNYSEGLASISAVLKQGGHKVSLMHMLYEHSEQEFKDKLKSFEFDLIGFSTRTTAFVYVQDMMKWVKQVKPDAFVYAGSYHVTLVPDEVLAAQGCDAVCIGEGEFPTLELCDKMRDGMDYTDVQSFYFKLEDGSVVRNPVRPLEEDMDVYPVPDFDLFDFKNLEMMRINTALVMMSRGCLFSCTYCGNSQFRNVYPNKKKYCRFRSPENALHYLKVLLEKFPQIEYINFRDAIFNMFPAWFDEFIELYKKEIHKPFTCNLRLDVLNEDTVRRMKEAGCYLIDVGVESGDHEIRTKYLKRMMTDEQMINAFSWFHKYNITTLTYNIVGLPYEDLSKTLKTIKLNVKLDPDKIIPNIFYPYPMTVLHDIAKEAGFVPDVIAPDEKVPLQQKNYPKHHVLFAAYYFMTYIKHYKAASKMPKFLGRLAEKFWDFTFLGPITPRKALVGLFEVTDNIRFGLKRFLMKRMPKFYLHLRNRRLKGMVK
ncbi:MAG: radical SAM protein [Eubacteriales bacterium]